MDTELLQLLPLQDLIIDDYIEKGGRGQFYQKSRGAGHTTAVAYLAIQQLLSTNRNVVFVSDMPLHITVMMLCGTAEKFFDSRVSRTNSPAGVLIDGKYMRIMNPRLRGIQGLRFDDIYGDIDHKTIMQSPEPFDYLGVRFGKSNEDGTGFYYLIVR